MVNLIRECLSDWLNPHLLAGHQLLQRRHREAEGLDLVVGDGVVSKVAPSPVTVDAVAVGGEADDGPPRPQSRLGDHSRRYGADAPVDGRLDARHLQID